MTPSCVIALVILILPVGAQAHFSQQGRNLITNAQELGDYKVVPASALSGFRVHRTTHCITSRTSDSCLDESALSSRFQFQRTADAPPLSKTTEPSIVSRFDPDPSNDKDYYSYKVNIVVRGAPGFPPRTLPLCRDSQGNEKNALALAGSFSESGDFEPAAANVLTFVCEGSVAEKCLNSKYDYNSDAAKYSACTRVFRADYCGVGDSYTLNDTPIEHAASTSMTYPREAVWVAGGALCLSKLRWATIAPPADTGTAPVALCPGNKLIDPRNPLNWASGRLKRRGFLCEERSNLEWLSSPIDGKLISGSKFMDRGLYTWRLDTAFPDDGPRPAPLPDGICSSASPDRLCKSSEGAVKDSYTTTHFVFGLPNFATHSWRVADGDEDGHILPEKYQYLRFEGTVFNNNTVWPPAETGLPSRLIKLRTLKRTTAWGIDYLTTTAPDTALFKPGFTEVYEEGKIFRPGTPCDALPSLGKDKTSAVPLYSFYNDSKDDYLTTTDAPVTLEVGDLHPHYFGYKLVRKEGYLIARSVDGLSVQDLRTFDCPSALRAPAGAAGGLAPASFDNELTGDAEPAGTAVGGPESYGCTTTRRGVSSAATALLLLLALPALFRRRRVRATA